MEAILQASRSTPVRVMFPMITTVAEMTWARSRLHTLSQRVKAEIQVGMMVETPAAALRAHDFVEVADFISLGTNDLSAYTLAADRDLGSTQEIFDSGMEAVFDLIAMAGRAFRGRPIGVCGDLASEPEFVDRLIALGVTELSVRPSVLALIKQAVRAST
jgi:phosphocarrier protein FPr